MMDEQTRAEIGLLVEQAVSKGMKSYMGEFSEAQHQESHRKMEEFFEMLGDMGKTARRAFINIIVTAIIALMALGIGFKCGWLKIG